MKKKVKPKKKVSKLKNIRTIPKPLIRKKEEKIDKILIENFVSLQKVMTNLSIKFDSLTDQISKLLSLFEMSAKALAEKDFKFEKGNKENKILMEKIDKLLDQNKTIARGLTIIHEKNPEESYHPQQVKQMSVNPPHAQQFQSPEKNKNMDFENHQKQQSSLPSKFKNLP